MDSHTETRKHKLSRLVLLAPGDEGPRARQAYQWLNDKLRKDLGDEGVALAYLQGDSPSMMAVAEQAAASGRVSELVVLPLFLAMAGPVEQAIPQQVAEIKQRFPQLGVIILPPAGEQPAVIQAVCQVARGAIR